MEIGKADSIYNSNKSIYNRVEDLGQISGYTCHTCHCPYGPLSICECGNCMCETCLVWSKGKLRTLAFNENKKTKKKQRYILDYIPIETNNCNICGKVVGYRL